MGDAQPLNFGVIVVPHRCDDAGLWDLLIEKFKKFRLGALRESPEAFSSTYERETTFEKDVWAGRLANSQATVLITVKDLNHHDIGQDTDKARMLLKHEWLVMIVLLEVEERVSATMSASQPLRHTIAGDQQPVSTGGIAFLNGVYVAPDYRGRGTGSAALKDAFEVGQAIAAERGFAKVVFRARVDAANYAASKLYMKAGFQEVRREQLDVGEKVKNGRILTAHEATILVLERVVSIVC